MRLSEKEKWMIILNLLLILAISILRWFLSQSPGNIAYHGILSLVYLTIYFEWLFSIPRRFLQRDMRRLLLIVAALMIFWIIVRYIKYEIIPINTVFSRYLWYSYYISMTLIPLQFFLATLYVGKTDRSDISRKWLLLYIPAAILVGGILSNDLHQQAFRFRPGFSGWNEAYSYGPLYYASAGMFILCMIGVTVMVFRTCVRHHFLKRFLLPAADLGIGSIYFYLYTSVTGDKSFIQRALELPEFTCLMLIGFWECLVFTNLIPSNRNYEDFFQASSIHAGLTDNAFTVQMRAASGITPPAEEIRASENGLFLMEDGDTLLKSHSVHGGHFYWMEDITKQKRLNRELEETRDYLTEEYAMLDETTKLEEGRKRTAQQNLLYDRITKSIQAQLGEVGKILDHLPENEEEFRHVFEYVGILGAYIKRRSNLLLLAGDGQKISSEELRLSILESLEYVRLLNVPCQADIEEGNCLSAGLALFLYELYEEILEASLPDLDGVLVTMKVTGKMLTFYMEISSPTDIPDTKRFDKAVRRFDGNLRTEYADGTGSVTFTMAMGGGSA